MPSLAHRVSGSTCACADTSVHECSLGRSPDDGVITRLYVLGRVRLPRPLNATATVLLPEHDPEQAKSSRAQAYWAQQVFCSPRMEAA